MATGNISTNDIHCDAECWSNKMYHANREMAIQNVSILVFMSLLVAVGIPGNLLVIIVYGTRKATTTTTNLFVIILACVDLTCCVTVHPYVISKLFNSYNQQEVILCKFFEFLIHFTLTASVLVLFVVAIDRYLAICRPFMFIKYQSYSTIILIVTFAIATVDSLPLLEFYGKRTISVPVTPTDTLDGYVCDFSDAYQGSTSMNTFGMIMFFLFFNVVLGMTIMYLCVARTAYRCRTGLVTPFNTSTNPKDNRGTQLTGNATATSSSSKRNDTLAVSSSRSLPVSTTKHVSPTVNMFTAPSLKQLNIDQTKHPKSLYQCYTVESEMKQQHQSVTGSNVRLATYKLNSQPKTDSKPVFSAKLKAAKILFLVTAVFLLSWLPFWVIRLCWMHMPEYMANQTESDKAAERFFMHLFYLNNAANPVIYTIINSNFRKECRAFCTKLRHDIVELLAQRT